MSFSQIFKLFLSLLGIAIIVLGTWVYDRNIILTTIGTLIVFISGIQVHLLIYQKDRDPEEIVKKIKDTVKQFSKSKEEPLE